MKTIKLQGKDYVQVSERIKYFRENYKDGRIVTSIQIVGDRAIFTASIYDGDKLLATGHGMKNITAEFNLEKAETRSIGRALGIAGIGIDCGVSTYEEAREFFDTVTPKIKAKDIELKAKKLGKLLLISEVCKKEFEGKPLSALDDTQLSRLMDILDNSEGVN